jgi:Flp pilus assembly protein TadG
MRFKRPRVRLRALGSEATRTHHSRGQALVELAIVSVALLLLLATVADFGRLFYTQITVENSARAGALVAARDPDSYTGACPNVSDANKIGCAITAEWSGSAVAIAASEIAVSCETTGGTPQGCAAEPQPGVRSRVTIQKPFSFLMPILSMVFGSGDVSISASVAADQQSLPAPVTTLPTPTATPAPTPTPSPSPTPTPTPTATPAATPTPTPAPTPSPTPTPCAPGFAPMPDLVVGQTPGSSENVAEARDEWQTAGFQPSNFSPRNGSNNKTVLSQDTTVGQCYATATTTVTVTHS